MTHLYLQASPEVSPKILKRLKQLLGSKIPVTVISDDKSCPELPVCQSNLDNALLLSLGNTSFSSSLITKEELKPLKEESYIIHSRKEPYGLHIAIRGVGHFHSTVNLGLQYGIYDVLGQLGFAFLHPFEPTTPQHIKWPEVGKKVESPYWKKRGFSHHTMHPLEMTDVLNGWGVDGPEDKKGWASHLKYWDLYLEWLVANRQNMVQWVLLEGHKWKQFSRSSLRQRRLKHLTHMAHQWGVSVGVDVPIALAQQHAWRLITQAGSLKDEKQQIRRNIDWLMAAKFDFLTTEMGLSEFHHPDDHRMIAWLNEAALYLDKKYQAPFWTKVHTSAEQFSKHYKDPQTNQPLNFNYLPYYAHPKVGVMPHTVQVYSLTDPAHTYGQKDFRDMGRYLNMERGRRSVLWFPETAYWVTYDIDVPLFLPVYAERRFEDLRHLAKQGQFSQKMDGQLVFSSGFEWGYWLNDVLSARSAWQPRMDNPDQEMALRELIEEVFMPFGPAKKALAELLTQTISLQKELLIKGLSKQVELRNGLAYLIGEDTWDQVGYWARKNGIGKGFQTQPDHLGLQEVRDNPAIAKIYRTEVRPLLQKIDSQLIQLTETCYNLKTQVAPESKTHYLEICDSLKITALRANFTKAIYEYANSYHSSAPEFNRKRYLKQAIQAIQLAEGVVTRREQNYRMDPKIIAGWRKNPTAYQQGYLWTVHSLYLWKRTLLQLVNGEDSFCFGNIIDPLEVALADPIAHAGAVAVRLLSPLTALVDLERCINPLKSPAYFALKHQKNMSEKYTLKLPSSLKASQLQAGHSWARVQLSDRPLNARLNIKKKVASVSPQYLSFAIDTSQVVGGHWWGADAKVTMGLGAKKVVPFDFSNPLLNHLTHALSPAYLRIGGSEADKVFYSFNKDIHPPEGYKFNFTREQFDAVNHFAINNQLDVFFTLNAGPSSRNDKRQWVPDNARKLIQYSRQKNYPVKVWELGNEINGYPVFHGWDYRIDGHQYAKDIKIAKKLLQAEDPQSKLAGPSSAYWPVVGEPLGIMNDFLKHGGKDVDIVTWHYYPQQSRRCPVASRRAGTEVMLNPSHLNAVKGIAATIENSQKKYAPQAMIWSGETGNAQCGGEPGVSDRFVSSLWWLDQLGSIARRGQPVMVRQTLVGSDYGLLDDKTFEPRPDYWASLLWKRLMGTEVLDVEVENENLRVYAHQRLKTASKESSLTLLVINISKKSDVQLDFGSLNQQTKDVYQVTAETLNSLDVYLNGDLLKLTPQGKLPVLRAQTINGEIIVPPLSYTFIDFGDVSAL